MADPLDAVRAEGRRLLARVTGAANPIAETGALARLGLFVQAHPALLAGPAPEGLSEEERRPANPYLRFTEQASPSGKTRTVDIHSERSGDALGRIAWYGPWRQYTFYPAGCSIWNTGCLDTVQGYIAALMEDRRG